MKTIVLTAFITAIVVMACTNSNTSSTGTAANSDSSRVEKNIANNLKVYDAIKSGDVSSLDSIFAPDVVDHDGPMGGEVHGKDSILKMLGDMHNHIKDLNFDIISSAGNGDYVFTLVHITGTTTDSSMGKPGDKIDMKSVDVVKMTSDNKLAEHWSFSEDADVAKRMAAMQNMKPHQK